MVKSKRMMETDKKTGIKRQFMPVTHVSAVLGLREFIQGNFFQADFDRVMGMLQEHYDKASAEIDQKAENIEKYANEKISEFDGKISDSNKRMTALEKEIQETQQIIEENDIPTRQEISANVVYQIAGTDSTVVPEKILVDGIAGTAVRNVNGTIRPFSQTDYDNLNSNIVIGTETTTNGNAAQFEFNMDVIAYIDSKYPSVFSGLTSTSDKLNKLKTVLKTIKVPHTARGATSSKFDWWNYQAASWAGLNFSNTASGFVEKIYEISSMSDVTFSRVFGNSGIFKTRIYSGLVSDGTQKSWVELRDFSLIIELEISAKDIIDYSIAAYHREMGLSNLVFKKVGEV